MSPRLSTVLVLSASVTVGGCAPFGSAAKDLPTSVKQVARGGFTSPADAVASPDGETFYFSARTDAGSAAFFRVVAKPGSQATALASGGPLLAPRGLVLSCDGLTLYGSSGGKSGAPIYALPTAGGVLTALNTTGIGEVYGLAIGPDCKTLFVTGRTPSEQPALFKVDKSGGAAQVVLSGAPLLAPGAVFVDAKSVAWVMDGATASGQLFAVPADGQGGPATTVVSGLRVSAVGGGVSLNSLGGTAMITTHAPDGSSELTAIELATGERTEIPTPEIRDPTGLRTARSAPVLAVADTSGDAIFRVE